MKVTVIESFMKLIYFFILLFSFSSFSASYQALDYAHLFPLKQMKLVEFITLEDLNLPTLIHQKSLEVSTKDFLWSEENMLMVGLRLDPCFRYMNDSKCHPQARLILQPSFRHQHREERVDYTTHDSATHLFYNFSDESQFKQLLKELRDLRIQSGLKTEKNFIGVHPILRKEKTRKEYKKIVLNKLSQAELVRATFSFAKNYTRWQFSGVEVINGKVIPMRLDNSLDGYVQQINKGFFKGHSHSELSFPEYECFEQNSHKVYYGNLAEEICETSLRNLMVKVEKFTKPGAVHVDNGDCISCHLSEPVLRVASSLYQSKKFFEKTRLYTDRHISKKLLKTTSNKMKKDPHNLRHFGYLNSDPVVSLRVKREVDNFLNPFF